MAVNRLYQQDPYLKETVTDVLACEPAEQGWALLLRDTIFHAKGGGQPSDGGLVDGQPLLDLIERGEEILHVVAERPARTEGVRLALDFDRRFDLMQQHTGQHILSTVIENLFDSDTSIFRCEERINQIDIAKPLSEEQLREAERETNRIIRQGLPVRSFCIRPEEMAQYQTKMRLPIAPHEVIQLVEIEDFDLIGCGGTHVARTDEVWSLKILHAKDVSDQKTAKGAMRLYFVCGGRAEQDYHVKNRAFYKLSALLGGEPEDLPQQVEALKQRSDDMAARLRLLEERLLAFEAADLLERGRAVGGVKLAAALLEDRDMRELRALAEEITKRGNAVVLLASEKGAELPVVMAQSKGATGLKAGDWLQDLLGRLVGKGGGGALFAQGTFAASAEAVEAVRRRFEEVGALLDR
ncbi:MAG: alanyl-tRNA editing protein [Clostridiales bacterium]|nr:alanyl-tRNA editing protein [Clostridiales bacterium]